MNLPASFLADLPPEATLAPHLVVEACRTLRRNREQHLAQRSTDSIVRALAEHAGFWRQPDYPFRQMAVSQGSAQLGFSPQTILRGLDAFFDVLTEEALHDLVVQELGHAQRLDGLVTTAAEHKLGLAALATGPELLVQIGAGNVPSGLWMSMVLGIVLRSAQFIKCATGSSLFPRLFAHSLADIDPKLVSCLEIAEWRGGREDLEEALFAQADCLTATGSDETLGQIRARTPLHVRFVGYGHRLSFGFVAREQLSSFALSRIVAAAVDDIVAWNQLGCLSPHCIYVEKGGHISPEQFAEVLAGALREREASEPRGELEARAAAAIASRRGFYEVRAGLSAETRLWCSEGSTAWTVVFENDSQFQPSYGNRFVFVKPVESIQDVLIGADAVRGKVSTVGIAAAETRVQELALQLGRWGVSRVCPLGRMQRPPLSWRHDGRSPLAELVSWTNWERS